MSKHQLVESDAKDDSPPASTSQKPAGRPRLVVVGEFEKNIRDPYLVDALRQLVRVTDDLREARDGAQIEEDVHLLCELSREITIRLIPFVPDSAPLLTYASERYSEILARCPADPDSQLAKYLRNIQKRRDEYAEFLQKLPAPTPAGGNSL